MLRFTAVDLVLMIARRLLWGSDRCFVNDLMHLCFVRFTFSMTILFVRFTFGGS